MLFQMAKLCVAVPVPVVATLAQRRAMAVWSGVRVALVFLPSACTSAKSAAYLSLVSMGGGGGRNCVDVCKASGAANWRCANPAGAFAGGVGCQRPGSGGSTYA